MFLEKINKPNDIHKIALADFPQLADEIRQFLIESVSRTGGHLASNLGAVELTLAIHNVLDFPEDKLIWDVGHQAYTHKILTGRKDAFATLRKEGGLSGFPKRAESDCDAFDAGHSSNSISAGLGYVRARDLLGRKNHVVSVIGDGALTGGMAYEALNNAAELDTNFIIVINDNNMSISKNVGGMSTYLSALRTAEAYTGMKIGVTKAVKKIPKVGTAMVDAVRRTKSSIKQLFIPGMLFENMGLTYLGPVNGHNLEAVIEILNSAKRVEGPVVVHVITKKGKGYAPAEHYPSAFHGVSPYEISNGHPKKKKTKPDWTDVFSRKICELAKNDKRIVAVTAAMPQGTGLSRFEKKYPRRFFDVGIAEEHAVTFAAGMAAGGMKPVVAIYSSFLQRAYDQILHDVCIQHLHVVFAIDRAGLVGSDGETHQGIFDLSFLTSIPNMTVMAPKNGSELSAMLEFALLNFNSPVAIRYPRGQAYDGLEEYNAPIRYGKAEMIIEESDIALVAAGNMLITAQAVREKLKEKGYNITIVNERFIKPVDTDMLDRLSESHRLIVTMEENVLSGGFGEAVCQYYDDTCNDIDVLNIALPDDYVEHGNVDILRRESGVDRDSIIAKVLNRWANVLNKDKRNE